MLLPTIDPHPGFPRACDPKRPWTHNKSPYNPVVHILNFIRARSYVGKPHGDRKGRGHLSIQIRHIWNHVDPHAYQLLY